jgi:hypothetical protein
MFERVERFLVSGLSQSEFCRQEGLGYHRFRYWLKKYHLKAALPSPAVEVPADFIPLRVVPAEPTAPSPACVIEYPSGVVVRLPGPLDATLVAQLIHAAGD